MYTDMLQIRATNIACIETLKIMIGRSYSTESGNKRYVHDQSGETGLKVTAPKTLKESGRIILK